MKNLILSVFIVLSCGYAWGLTPEENVELPLDQEVCFAPDEPCALKLAKFIGSANQSLDIAIFDINLDQIVHEISVAFISKKIPVRVLVDNRSGHAPASLVSTLIKVGVPVRVGRQRGIMHNKFAIVDKRMVVTGSFNFTNGASTMNNENQLYFSNPAIVNRYVNQFEKIWNQGKVFKPSKEKVKKN